MGGDSGMPGTGVNEAMFGSDLESELDAVVDGADVADQDGAQNFQNFKSLENAGENDRFSVLSEGELAGRGPLILGPSPARGEGSGSLFVDGGIGGDCQVPEVRVGPVAPTASGGPAVAGAVGGNHEKMLRWMVEGRLPTLEEVMAGEGTFEEINDYDDYELARFRDDADDDDGADEDDFLPEVKPDRGQRAGSNTDRKARDEPPVSEELRLMALKLLMNRQRQARGSPGKRKKKRR
jgi:hypothetical protein